VAKKYMMVRLNQRTHARLCRMRDELFAAYQEGKVHLPDEYCEHLSLDFVVNRLMDRVLSHRRRAQRSRQMREKARADPGPV
jgi:hypothetical protein